jgi:hypothetical protein
MRARPMNVSQEVWDRWFEILRSKTAAERLEMARQMTLSWQRTMFAILRERHPELPDREIWLKLAVRRLGAETVKRVYGRDIDPL